MKTFGIIVGSLVALILVLGLIAPKDFKVRRDIIIDRPQADVYAYVKQLKHQSLWNSWFLKDPKVKMDYKGEDGTVGFIVTWESSLKEVGVGEQEIKNLVDNNRVDTEIRFKIPMEASFDSYVITESVDPAQTRVTMGMHDELAIPMNVMSFLFNKIFGGEDHIIRDMDQSLINLKTQLEQK
ncbi:SRPBCC family protein [Bdellovibrio bacteriovorus]|uniref:Polyketide cyclase n=1 Tax=Bdellovibrio bacteriovorus (strain ATCC 15356 / DSM 50701 / NCIMB 9529 / HD100) TaxID=264462 RepID=Q6MHA0_BDEBA|nr:SRPBCC family protein [Bdellovibrio bacteriovorus]AHZ85426.1 hypothetical protein EP01_10820 [Bdellovibrio bacteriovorus]BEV69972.1 hypothetical protein Bb109J_c3392 [Bdellovibrio bacteriovorus]CAE81027.1 conserved hypothetical protein [Bdellovibrio bacteriovorus HD100]